jgi:site-specific recombinase XerD
MITENLDNFKLYLISNGHANLSYAYWVKNFLDNVSEISENSINGFLANKRINGNSSATINICINAIKAYLKFKKIKNIMLPKTNRVSLKMPSYISLEFLENTISPKLKYLFHKKNSFQYKVLLYFMFFSGLRKSEVLGLERNNISLKNKELKVYCKKTKSERMIPLNNRMVTLLRAFFRMFPEKNNALCIRNNTIDYVFKILRHNFPEVKFHPHLMRCSFAMYLQKKGFTTREIQVLLGHKSILSTVRYEQVDNNLIKEKFDKL